ncbi:Glucosidase 2 subunit beta like [Actinidia chinensis var. chinensis]|uniref:Glucosidase 2 subunit beta like n=1 Tax=Actinidia chinensis var. chinensis TaxID=1590841 RepID=A0A2R6R7J3_ACTCC|nr:Glucosidase 2 subunit beta like [Actinidia chinensis var. chinensis]
MAAAEARAAWQRTANRCFVQEDAKRAPKLACCPSASSSSKQADDAGPANATDGHDSPNVSFLPLNNPSYSNLPPESRWWLQMQPNYGYQKAFTNEQLSTLEVEMESSEAGVLNSTSKASEVQPQLEDDHTRIYGQSDNFRTSAVCMKKDPEVEKKELKTICSKSAQEPLKPKKKGDSYELLEMDPVGCSVSKQADGLSFDSDSPWIGSEKTEPWWRVADRYDLAFLVAQRSLDLIENCDLPRPQNTHFKKDPYACLGNFDRDGILPSSKDLKAPTGSNPTVKIQGNLTLGSSIMKQRVSSDEQAQYGSDMQNSDAPTHKAMTETQNSDGDPGKAQLLEALCHSQTRAREAEKAAKQAYAEKEHILKLFFRQASHLFAYKQWFQLLQLENLYFQIKNNNVQPISTLFPVMLPWMPHKTRKLQKGPPKPPKEKRRKQGRPRHDISKFTVAFALGLGLVGAGLLLGWTVGWMLPAF